MIELRDIQQDEYAAYYRSYLNLLDPSSKLDEILADSLDNSLRFMERIDKPFDFRYADGKWTIGQVLLHNIDTERVFAYRALRFLRQDATPLPGFDQDVFMDSLGDPAFAKADLIKSMKHTRLATVELFRNASPTALNFKGQASDQFMTARVIPFLIAGHHLHHEMVLQERYLS